MQPDLDLPDFLRIPQDERRKSWKGRKLTPSRVFATQHARLDKPTDPGTIKLLAEIAARESAEAERKAIAKEDARVIREKMRTRDRAVLAAVAQLHLMMNPNATEQEIEMAKAKKTTKKPARKSRKEVVTRFKTKTPKKAEALKKPSVPRAPRGTVTIKGGGLMASAIADAAPKIKAALQGALETAVKTISTPKADKPESKGAKLERLLRAGKVSAADLAEQLEWLPHTTRAAISRVGFEVTTEKKDGVTLYHIAKDAAAKPKATQAA